MPAYINITDGSESVIIGDGLNNFALADEGWAPAVSMDDSPVTETIVIDILDGGAGTVAAVQANAEKLQRILRNARRQGRGQYRLNSVYMEYSTDAASPNPNPRALLLDAQPLLLPTNLNDLLLPGPGGGTSGPSFDGVTVVLTRRGSWVATAETLPLGAAAANGSAISTATFGTSKLTPCLMVLSLGTFAGTNCPIIQPALILVANATSKLGTRSIGGSDGAPWSNVAEAGTQSIDGTIWRYTPAVATEVISSFYPLPVGFTSSSYRTGVFVCLRNNGSATYRVTMYVRDTVGVNRACEGVLIPAGPSNPQWYYLGSVSAGAPASTVALSVQANALGSTLDIDAFSLIDLTDEATSRVVAITESYALAGGATANLIIGSQPQTKLYPRVEYQVGGSQQGIGYNGNPEFLSTGSVVAVMWLATYGAYWAQINDNVGGDPRTTIALTGTRYWTTQTPEI